MRPEYFPNFDSSLPPQHEDLQPGHFYAAYVFDQVEARENDVREVVKQAHVLGYPLRYWWLSEALDLGGCPDRLIVCVHHPSSTFDSGMDLYTTLTDRQVRWDDLEAATLDEYLVFGRPLDDILNLRHPDGVQLFPHHQ